MFEKTAKATPHRVAYTVPEVQMLNHFPFSKDPFKMKKGIGESEIESCVQKQKQNAHWIGCLRAKSVDAVLKNPNLPFIMIFYI